MEYRKAKESDYKQLMLLYNQFVGEDRYASLKNDSFHIVLKNPNNYMYVAEEKGQLIGFASFSVRDVVRYAKPIAELDELFVIPEYRERGIGKHFLHLIEQQAKERNCQRVFIESHYKHEIAHTFYESLGYKNYGYHFIKDL